MMGLRPHDASSLSSAVAAIESAVARRSNAQFDAEGATDAYRLVNGAADGVPGLFVDRFDDALVVHADSEQVLHTYQPILASVFSRSALAIAKVHPREASRAKTRELVLWGDPPTELIAHERGVRYAIRPLGAGLNVGLFVDMREVRSWLREHAKNRTVLNLFAYTCSFGVVACLGSAQRVLNLDLSRQYLAWGRRNYALNELPAHQQDFVYGDAFDWLARFVRRDQTFDVVILDPPSFSTARGHSFSVERDYTRLVTSAARTVAPGGILLAATNHAAMSNTRFDAWLRAGLEAAGRRGRIDRRWHEPAADFPGPHPYLKVRALTLD
jgi:23S rRNA (cytosine1962-C5)-methyltransferase